MKRALVGLVLMIASVCAFAEDGPEAGAHLPSQAVADVLREFTGADGAFVTASFVKESFSKDNLASLIQFPSDEIVVVNLTGAQIKEAFEKSVALYPQHNQAFLQISGFEATFTRSGSPLQRIVSVTANGGKLDEKHVYSVAMPASLGRGGSGYFKIWDSSKIAKTFANATMESVLKGKRYSESSPRWSVSG